MKDLREVMSEEAARQEVDNFLDTRMVLPKRRAALEAPIDAVVEAMTYGKVVIKEDGTITQHLFVPVAGVDKLTYAAEVTPETINKLVSNIKVFTQTNINLEYISAYTNTIKAVISKMHPTDRNIADALAFFYQ
jgi:hypothetical protein